MRRLTTRLDEAFAAFGGVFRSPDLRRLELAWAASMFGSWAYGIALAVYAYETGGARAVGIVGFARWAAGAVASPFAAAVSDRVSRKLVMVAVTAARAVALGCAAAVIYVDGPAAVVYVIAAVVSILSTAFRPAQAALLPSLARTAEELTAANVVSSTIESLGIFGGPGLGGLLLVVTGPATVFAASAGAMAFAAALLVAMRRDAPPERVDASQSVVRAAAEGVTTIAADRRLRLLIGLFSAQTFVSGMLSVLVVVLAVRMLDLGEPGVGYLNAALGLGGVLGAVVSAALVGRARLAADFGLGILLWGGPIALVAAWVSPVPALVLLAIVGAGNTVVDVAGMTLLQRAAPEAALARVFGVLESLILITIALGALVAPALVAALGDRATFVAAGVFLPALMLLSWRTLSELDAEPRPPAAVLDLLVAVPIFAPLPPPTLERVASLVEAVELPGGSEAFHRGDAGDRFYVVDAGELTVDTDAGASRRLGRGDWFGEIALLRDVPRTATVRAVTDARLLALERGAFIAAVTGHAPSLAAADAVIEERLGPAGLVRA